VAGAGGLQALVKSGLNIRGKRVIVAGSGPLLLAVAHLLADRGASIQAIVEQADGSTVRGFAMGLWRNPSKLVQAAWLRASLFAVPYWTGAWPVRAEPVSPTDAKLGAVVLYDGRQELRVPCDLMACGFGLVPNLHLAALFGVAMHGGFARTDELMKADASSGSLWCAGEITGIGGVEVSVLEGKVAGLAAADNEAEARRLLPALGKARAFASRLNQAFTLRAEVRALARHETVVCRCEDVAWGRIKGCTSWRDAKLQTRCGMGPCQGRVCGPAVAALTGWEVGDARPPASSVAARALLSLLAPDPAPTPSVPTQEPLTVPQAIP
jgi:NADPH-dependent 2,4-dienoyl-CoA reductase/sulfur reductase-like enzyme